MNITINSSSSAGATHSVIVLKKAMIRICSPRTWIRMRNTQTILSVRMTRKAVTLESTKASRNAVTIVTQRMMKSNKFQLLRQ